MASITRTALVGTAAGLAATEVMDRISMVMYQHTDPANIQREKEIEEREPPQVLVQKLERRLGLQLNKQQQQRLSKLFHYGTGLSAAMLYVALARRWKLGWFTGGLAFGTLFWAVFDEGISPAMGLVGDNTQYPLEAHVRGLAAHVGFGVVAAALAEVLGAASEG